MGITVEKLIALVECPDCIIAEAPPSRMHELYLVNSPWKKSRVSVYELRERYLRTYECIEIAMSTLSRKQSIM